jgi:uncharacterized protein YlbG (UPF0298 family)
MAEPCIAIALWRTLLRKKKSLRAFGNDHISDSKHHHIVLMDVELSKMSTCSESHLKGGGEGIALGTHSRR